MRILFLCEGVAEAEHGSFSGSTKSLIDALRSGGSEVIAGDAEIYGLDRALGAALTFAPDRRRWGVRFHLASVAFRLRSRRAARAIAAHRAATDCILQIGATFEPSRRGALPYFLYCDSNIAMAELGRPTGESDASSLHPSEVATITAREARVYRGASAIFTMSDRLKQSFVEDFHIPPGRIHAVGAGPNFDATRIPPRAPLGAGGRRPLVLFVGKHFLRKGGDLLLAALARVRETIPDAHAILIGPDALRDVPPGVECWGFLRKDIPADRDRLLAAYASADLFCLPTRYDPLGIAFLEAMFFGLPCVGPAAWAVPEMIRDGVTGYTFPPENVGALAERILRLLSDPAGAYRMGEAGRAIAQTRFTWRGVAETMTREMSAALANTAR